MKKVLPLLLALVVLIGYNAKASHIAGGEILYEHVAGTARTYNVTLILYADFAGINFGNTQTVNYTSSCNGGGSLTMTLPPGTVANDITAVSQSGTYDCVPSTASGSVIFSRSLYTGQVTLPVNCSDWDFYWQSCCRNGAISNIQTPSGQGFVIIAKLNNNLGQNTSPTFANPPIKQFCVNTPQPFNWNQGATEPDGDQLSYVFGQPLDNPYPGTAIPWAAGYSLTQPMTTVNGISLNPLNGTFTFQPSQNEVDVFKVDVEERRFDPTLLSWVFVGSVTRELQVPIATDCNAAASSGPQINTTAAGFSTGTATDSLLSAVYSIDSVGNPGSIDPVTGQFVYDVSIIEYSCFNDVIHLDFGNVDVQCNSITNDGNEFRLIGPDGVLRPIIAAETQCSNLNVQVNEIDLRLHRRLDVNGTYVLYVKRAYDQNTLLNECGFPLTEYTVWLVTVNNCPGLDYSLDRVTVENDKDRLIEWSIDDPNYLQPSLFDYWRLGMNVGGATYFREIQDINARSFLDTEEFITNHVDHQNFTYSIQLVQNADFKAPAEDQITTVRLRAEYTQINTQARKIDLGWNAYNGFDGADSLDIQYDLFIAKANADSSITPGTWTFYSGAADNYFAQYDIDETTTANDGLYAMKVEAQDLNNPPPAGLISESNWIYFTIGFVPLPDLTLKTYTAPNIFTPNNDNRNDRFYIQSAAGGREYADIQLSVFNRWGQLVYEDSDFGYRNTPQQGWDGSDIYTGAQVSDGVYYYMIKMFDPETGTSEDLQGSVTITSN